VSAMPVFVFACGVLTGGRYGDGKLPDTNPQGQIVTMGAFIAKYFV
jgi:hypothetical protein